MPDGFSAMPGGDKRLIRENPYNPRGGFPTHGNLRTATVYITPES